MLIQPLKKNNSINNQRDKISELLQMWFIQYQLDFVAYLKIAQLQCPSSTARLQQNSFYYFMIFVLFSPLGAIYQTSHGSLCAHKYFSLPQMQPHSQRPINNFDVQNCCSSHTRPYNRKTSLRSTVRRVDSVLPRAHFIKATRCRHTIMYKGCSLSASR